MELHFRTGHPRADEALLAIVGAFEDTFAADHCRYVLLGSYATGAARDTSDLDLLIVFARPLTDTDGEHAGRLMAGITCNSRSKLMSLSARSANVLRSGRLHCAPVAPSSATNLCSLHFRRLETILPPSSTTSSR